MQRAGDCAARYGGEEFAALLPGLSAAEAMGVAETIRLKVQQWSGDAATTTVSIGVASLMPDTATDWNKLVNAADKALYAAKAGGRNCCVLASVSKLSLAA
jgi:diguanylate cyclase (GGDEF)-like protein